MRNFATALVVLAICCAAAPWATADEPAKGEKIRVLVTVGGHAYEEAPFWAMWDALPGVQWTKAELPKQADLLKPGLEKQYDVIAMYDMCPGISAEQQEAFAELLKKGIGVVAMHHNLGGHPKWDEFRRIIGGKFCTSDCTIEDKPYKTSTWDHDQELKVTVVDKDHPITKGMENFKTDDELYAKLKGDAPIHVLIEAYSDWSKKVEPLIFWQDYGKGRVVHNAYGHDGKALATPEVRKIIARGTEWAATGKVAESQ
jgi:uncharacterized protein